MNSKQLIETNEIVLKFNYQNFFILKNTVIEYELNHINKIEDYAKVESLARIGLEMGKIFKLNSLSPDLIICIPRGGRVISKLISQILEIPEIESNQGKHKCEGSVIKGIQFENVKEVLIVDSIIDKGDSVINLISEIECNFPEVFPRLRINLASVFTAYDAVTKINSIYPQVKLFTTTINSKITWIKEDSKKFKRIIADLPDIGDIVGDFYDDLQSHE